MSSTGLINFSNQAIKFDEFVPGGVLSPSLPKENKIWGAVLSFFGQALKVEQFNGKVDYVKIDTLKRHLIFCRFGGLSSAEYKNAFKDPIIQDLFLSTINPLKGTTVKWETLKQFDKLAVDLKYNPSNAKETYGSLRKIRASIYSQKGMTEDQKEFISTIKVGDILFHRTDDSIRSDIVTFQSIAKKIGFGQKHRDAIHHNHAYMCAKIDEFGKKWFAEAAWPSGKQDEIRLVSEDDMERCFVKQNHGAISEIFRCNDQALAEKAAEEACKITTPLKPQVKGSSEKQPTELRYSRAEGAQALFSSSRFGHMAKVRMIRQIRSSKEGDKPTDFIKPKSFFCSSLVGYAFQAAEARPIVEGKLKEKRFSNYLGNILQPQILAFRFRNLLDQKIKFKIDPKRSTPAVFYSWICENKKLFTSIQSYQQPDLKA